VDKFKKGVYVRVCCSCKECGAGRVACVVRHIHLGHVILSFDGQEMSRGFSPSGLRRVSPLELLALAGVENNDE